MGKIIINNNSGIAKIHIDGQEVGIIKKETKEYEVATGSHTVLAKAAWCGSQTLELNISDDQELVLELNSFKYESIFKVVMFGLVLIFFLTKSMVFLILAIIVLIYPMYYVTFGKDSYLELTQKDI
ncbi:hypothetical protein [Cellulophaga sp. L1A9]|uniref:hypothetical protein n=1 Tax=Cellulophaga sp. L1A9 TaxID=2686362 RepID=UPI00131C36E7|nr:hypothetical protein [Cellulophaga sp. L1A9]